MRRGAEEPRDVVQANRGEGSQTLRFRVHGTSRRDKSTETEQPGGRRGGLRGSAGHGRRLPGPWGFPLCGGDVLEPAEPWLLHVVTAHSATELRARKRLTLGSRSHVWIFYLIIKNDSRPPQALVICLLCQPSQRCLGAHLPTSDPHPACVRPP